MISLFDTHAHYYDEKFNEDIETLIESLRTKNEISPYPVGAILNCSEDIESAKKCIELSEKYDIMYAAVGLHPHNANSYRTEMLEDIAALCKHEKVVALGEAGLDYHYDFSEKEKQIKAFSEQLALAHQLKLPIVIHDREAHGDCMQCVKESPCRCGILHSFSASAELATEYCKLGFYISFSGSLTFKNAVNLQRAAKQIPRERILIETDSPYLSPVPYRGKRNDSSKMYHTALFLADILNESVENITILTHENAKKVLNL